MERKDIEEIINKNDIEFIQVEIIDLNGISRSVITPIENFLKNIESNGSYHSPSVINLFTVTGDVIEGTGAGFEIDVQNIEMKPDLSTFKHLPWIENTASVLCDVSLPKIDFDY